MGEELDWRHSFSLTRLYVVCEGLTEATFVDQFIKSRIEALRPGSITVNTPLLRGQFTYAKVRKEIRTLLGKPDSDVRVTTMIDLFKLAQDFPGFAECDVHRDPWMRVEALEKHFLDSILDNRFLPYIQLHEFEALILADLFCLAKRHPNRKAELRKLSKTLQAEFGSGSPEEVNRLMPPARRIRQAVPEYAKVVDGCETVREIGLEKIRGRCPHFDRWLNKLERLLGV